METARITTTHSELYPINVQVWKDGIYSGEGRFCTTAKEAVQYIKSRDIPVEDYDTDLLFCLDEDLWDILPETTTPLEREHGKCIGYRQEAYHDVHIYEDGYEDRTYIGD